MEQEPNQTSVAEEAIEPDDESTESFKDLGLSDQLIEVIEDLILNHPLEEVQLTHSGVKTTELDPLPPAEGIEHLFIIRFEM